MLYLRLKQFRNTSLLFFSLLLSFSFMIYFFMLRQEPKDIASFENLLKESFEIRSKRALEKQSAVEIRSDVQKDIWRVKNHLESHLRLINEKSQLNIFEKAKKFSVEEVFSSLKGWVKPSDGEPYQIEAAEGFYELPSFQFSAQKIKLTTDSTFSLEANHANLENLAQPLQLDGDIRFVSLLWEDKPTYALAQKALYIPQKQLFILKGSEKKPVLCWQAGASFAAPELHVKHHQKTVQGIGDIRCSLDQEEQKTFQEIFSRYL